MNKTTSALILAAMCAGIGLIIYSFTLVEIPTKTPKSYPTLTVYGGLVGVLGAGENTLLIYRDAARGTVCYEKPGVALDCIPWVQTLPEPDR